VPNTKDIDPSTPWTIFVAGPGGSGKTTQIWTLPGKKFAYLFDPNAKKSLEGLDLDYEMFLPDMFELDFTIKGFSKQARQDDKPIRANIEPTMYMRWVDDLNKREKSGFFDLFDWVCIDSVTFLGRGLMDRNLFINNRLGKEEEIADYKIVGGKLSSIFRTITGGLGKNLYCTGHLQTYQDDKTKRIETQLFLPGSARVLLPLLFDNVLLAGTTQPEDKDEVLYDIRTTPDNRGLKNIRCSIPDLNTFEDVTIKDFNRPEEYGIGAILERAKERRKAA